MEQKEQSEPKEKKEGFFRKILNSLTLELKGAGVQLKGVGSKVKDWETISVLKLEIRRLDERTHNLLYELGLITFSELSEKRNKSVGPENEPLAAILKELEETREIRDQKEEELKEMEKSPVLG